MITENLSTLKIHKLTQKQYDRELEAGRIDENALYLTPDEAIDMSEFVDATLTQEGKAADSKAVGDKFASLVGDKKVSEQISTAIASKSDTGHTHDDRYYTESEINTKLSGKSDTSHNHDTAYAAKSHGNHVPATETANNAKFLRNDNTWQTVTPANIGAAASSHGTHVTFATTTPKAAGTASAGSATTVSRSDHVHPAQTSITGNAATATKATQDGSGNVITSTYATKTALNAVSALVGDTAVSTQINNAVNNKVSKTESDMTALFASGKTILSSNQFGDSLPAAGNAGRIFFKKVSD